MRPDGIRWIGSLAAAAASAALASSCTLPMQAPVDATPPAARSVNVIAGWISQIEFGRQAGFARCLPPACRAVTPKTLAPDVPPALPKPRPIDTAASLTEGEALVPATGAMVPTAPTLAKANVAQPDERLTRQVVVHFAFGDATLTPTARELIDEVARPLASARRIAISGRTDSVGPQRSNQLLAAARANAVRDHLRARHPHLAPAVTLEAQGACCYAASNETPAGRALNRRVEVVLERDVENL
ncbi:MAG: OmpA family protein [Burkholderiaceae bacterium]|nr:OmpA family protein [Burkholderiaceae bacterium]